MPLICLYIFCCYLLKLSLMNEETNQTSIYSLVIDINNYYNLTIEFLNIIRDYPDNFTIFINCVNDSWNTYVRDLIINTTEYSFLIPMIEDILTNKSNTFINDVLDILKNNSSNISILIDSMINIIDLFKNNNSLLYSLLENLEKILNFSGVDKLSNYFLHHNGEVFNLTKLILKKTKFNLLFQSFKDILWEYKNATQRFFFDIIKNYSNNSKLSEIIVGYIDEYNSSLIENFTQKLTNKSTLESISKLFKLKNKNLDKTIKALIISQEVVKFFIYLIRNKKIIPYFIDFFKHFQNAEYILEKYPEIIKELYTFDKNEVDEFLKVSARALDIFISSEGLKSYLTNNATLVLKEIFYSHGIKFNKTISKSCSNLFENIFFNNDTNTTNFKNFYFKKLIFQSSKNKNDFLSYENCLKNKYFKETKKFDYDVKPVFLIAIIDDIKKKQKMKSSIYLQKFDYTIGICFPYGIYKSSKNHSSENNMCNRDDYNNIIQFLLEFAYNMETTTINSFNIYDYDIKPGEYIYCILSILIVFFPFVIYIFLVIYKMIKLNKIEKSETNNKLNIERKIEQNKEGIENLLVEKKKKFKMFIEPNWYKHLNEYFNIIDNGKELFNFDTIETKNNNLKGITYIKGLLGISMILYICGYIFLILFNMPTKRFMQYEFYQLFKHPLYIIIFIGLRYSPHVMFSCSGYTLAYKFLCFYQEYCDYHLLKFLLLQSYKFPFLIMAILFVRHSIYYIDLITWKQKRPIMEIFKYYMNEKNENILWNFINYFTNFFGDNNLKITIDILQYFYVPLNEIIFFIFGTILISLGYKFKLRIDYIIIAFILIILCAKICIFYSISDFYSTLYFYSYDYGALIVNPIFNFHYFLIGMFFGFTNYSIQKGIDVYKINKKDNYSKFSFSEKKINSYEFIELSEDKQIENGQPEKNNKKLKSMSIERDYLKLNDKYNPKKRKKKNSDPSIKLPDYITQEKSQLILEEKQEEVNTNLNNNEQNGRNSLYALDEIRFLTLPTYFLYFHRKNKKKWYLKAIIIFFYIFLIFSVIFKYIIFYIPDSEGDSKKSEQENIYDKYSLENLITNKALNFFYLIDTEIVIFLLNWTLLIFYTNAEEHSDIFDFLNHIYWSFFVKCYFSFLLISTVVTIYIFYQSETVISINLFSVLLYSLINLFLIIIFAIIFYISFELPLKKIFKDLVINRICCRKEVLEFIEDEED